MKAKAIFYSAIGGVTIGCLISVFFSFLYSPTYSPIDPVSTMGRYYYANFHPALVMLIAMVIWALIGTIFSLGNVIFRQDWSLIKMTLVHYLTMLLGFIPLAILAGWFPLSLGRVFGFILTFSVVYLMIYAINYMLARQHILEINRKIKTK